MHNWVAVLRKKKVVGPFRLLRVLHDLRLEDIAVVVAPFCSFAFLVIKERN